jgi:hypothetical protein
VNNLPQQIKILELNCSSNQILNLLSDNIEELWLGQSFHSKLLNLPSSIKTIGFDLYSCYNQELDNLPDSIEFLHLPKEYNKKINILPLSLKKIFCSKDYIFENTNSYKNYYISSYSFIY